MSCLWGYVTDENEEWLKDKVKSCATFPCKIEDYAADFLAWAARPLNNAIDYIQAHTHAVIGGCVNRCLTALREGPSDIMSTLSDNLSRCFRGIGTWLGKKIGACWVAHRRSIVRDDVESRSDGNEVSEPGETEKELRSNALLNYFLCCRGSANDSPTAEESDADNVPTQTFSSSQSAERMSATAKLA